MTWNMDKVMPYVYTAAAGGVAGMLLLSLGFGFSSPATIKKIADKQAEAAVIDTLAPYCAKDFRVLSDVTARTAVLIANKANSYEMRKAFPDELITLPGKNYPDSDLTAACAKLVLDPPKSAALK